MAPRTPETLSAPCARSPSRTDAMKGRGRSPGGRRRCRIEVLTPCPSRGGGGPHARCRVGRSIRPPAVSGGSARRLPLEREPLRCKGTRTGARPASAERRSGSEQNVRRWSRQAPLSGDLSRSSAVSRRIRGRHRRVGLACARWVGFSCRGGLRSVAATCGSFVGRDALRRCRPSLRGRPIIVAACPRSLSSSSAAASSA